MCIYLDGLSRHLHGNPETAERDRAIRSWLRNNGHEVIEIAATDLHDQGAMTQHFRRLANYLGDRNLGQQHTRAPRLVFDLLTPKSLAYD